MPHTPSIALALILTGSAWAGVDAPPAYPLLEYRSSLADYVPRREPVLSDWRAVNEEMERLGGHMGHAREGAGGHDHQHGGPAAPGRDAETGHAGHGGGAR